MRVILILFCGLLSFITVSKAQQQKQITKVDGLFKQVYWVEKNDTSIKQGRYILYYKGRVVERGVYEKNAQVGGWQFFSFDNIFEFAYDFDTKKILKLSGEEGKNIHIQSPCLFLGTPILPYMFIVKKLAYPVKAKDLEVSGRVVLTLRVNKKGKVYGYYISEKMHPILDKAVMRNNFV